MLNDKEYSFASYDEAQKDEKIVVTMIKSIIHAPVFDEKEEWVKQYIKQFGTEPNFF